MNRILIGYCNDMPVFFIPDNKTVYLKNIHIYGVNTIKDAIDKCKVNLKNFREA